MVLRVAAGSGSGGSTALQNNLLGGTPGTAALDAAQGPNLLTNLAPVTLTGATTLYKDLHGNRQIIYNGASASLTVATDAAAIAAGHALWVAGDGIDIVTLDTSTGVPMLVTSDTIPKSITGSGTQEVGGTCKASNSWTVGTTGAVSSANPFTFSAMQVPNSGASTIVATLSRAGWQGTLPAASAFACVVAGTARTISSLAWTNATTITFTLASAVTNGQTVTLAYTENTTARIVSLDTDTPLQSFAASTVTNNVGATTQLTAVDATAGIAPQNLTTTDGTNNWAYRDLAASVQFKASPPLGAITNSQFGGGAQFLTTSSGISVTCTGADTQGGGSGQTNNNAVGGISAPAAGTAFGEQYVIPVTTATRAIDIYFVNGGDVGTLTAVLADGSATFTPVTVANGVLKKYTFTCIAGSTTTLTITLSNANASGSQALYFPLVAVR